uniref:Phospholipid scramblase n=1 Tax=Laticauda laticaudata TaxID=8630 RepID=A0A8C5RFK6_LATLA
GSCGCAICSHPLPSARLPFRIRFPSVLRPPRVRVNRSGYANFSLNVNISLYKMSIPLTIVILGTETCSKYEIKNYMGQRLYYAVEENGFFDRNFCAPLRSFTIRITDNTGQEVITVNRPLRCSSCWFPCYLQQLEVQSPPGTTIGYVVQKWDPLLPIFTIRNGNDEDVLKITGPYITCGCFGDVDFQVKSLNDMSTIGKISKYWSGFVNNIFTNTANFGIQIPVDLDVKIKAMMIGACFLLVSFPISSGTKLSLPRGNT